MAGKGACAIGWKEFGSLQLDVSPRAHELGATDLITLPNSLEFAGVAPVQVEIIDIHRHAAEKLHAMARDFGERENSRVRDLVDVVILIEHGLLNDSRVGAAAKGVWAERDRAEPPATMPSLPETWRGRYERLIADLDLTAGRFDDAIELVQELWNAAVRPTERSN